MRLTERILTKIHARERLIEICHRWKQEGHTIVFTNGCFDILHKGHLQILTASAGLGDKLVIGLNTDQSVKRLKGDQRPVNDEEFRAWMMASLEIVDAVVLFDEETPGMLIEALSPDILVKGGDYSVEQIVGAGHVIERGGQVKIIPFVDGFSTTNLIKIIQQL